MKTVKRETSFKTDLFFIINVKLIIFSCPQIGTLHLHVITKENTEKSRPVLILGETRRGMEERVTLCNAFVVHYLKQFCIWRGAGAEPFAGVSRTAPNGRISDGAVAKN